MSQVENRRSLRRAAVKWSAAATATTLLAVAVASYFSFGVWEYAPSSTSWYQVVVRDANVGMVRVAASFPDERPDEFSLDEHVLGWQRMPVVSWWLWLNRERTATDSVRIRETKANCSLYILAALTIFAAFVWPSLWRNRWRAPLLSREMYRPSDLAVERRPLRRRLKRFAAVMGFLLFAVFAALSVTDVVERWAWPMESVSIMFPTGNTSIPTTIHASTPWSTELASGAFVKVYVQSRSMRLQLLESVDALVPGGGWAVEWLGLHVMYRSFAGPMTSMLLNPAPGAKYVETSASIPTWMPATILALMLGIVFLRGPWRRHQRVVRGDCLRCGYCLTGLVNPRCPECGTEMVATNTGWRPRVPGEIVRALSEEVEV